VTNPFIRRRRFYRRDVQLLRCFKR